MQSNLIHSCTIQVRSQDSSNDYGEPVNTWADEQTSVKCRFYIQRITTDQSERHRGGELVQLVPKILLDSDVTVTEDDRRVVTTETGFAGTYDILKVYPRYTGHSLHHYECDLRKVV